MRIRKILYIIGIIVLLILNVLYVDFQFFAALVLVIILPVISGIMFVAARIGLKIKTEPKQMEVMHNNNIKLLVDINNRCYLPISRGRLDIVKQYSNTEKEDLVTITADPVQCIHDDVAYEVNAEHCGLLDIGARLYSGSDYLGLFCLQKQLEEKHRIIVLPEILKPEEQDKKAHHTIYEDEESVNSFQEQDEMAGLRTYMPADPKNRIHWKLSLKKDDLIVREYGNCIVKQNVIMVDLSTASTEHFREELDQLYQAAYSVGFCYIAKGKQSEFMAWNDENGSIEEYIFDDELTLKNAMVDLMSLNCSVSAWTKLENAIEQSDFVVKENSILLTTQEFPDNRYYIVDVAKVDMQKRITDINEII